MKKFYINYDFRNPNFKTLGNDNKTIEAESAEEAKSKLKRIYPEIKGLRFNKVIEVI